MSEYTYGYSYWSNNEDISVSPPLVRVPRTYLTDYDMKPLYTLEDSLIQNLRIYLRFLEDKLKETNVQTNSGTEQAALDELREHLKPRIEKTTALLQLVA